MMLCRAVGKSIAELISRDSQASALESTITTSKLGCLLISIFHLDKISSYQTFNLENDEFVFCELTGARAFLPPRSLLFLSSLPHFFQSSKIMFTYNASSQDEEDTFSTLK
jgi:hypothetical protein